jgi:hypothetical protein
VKGKRLDVEILLKEHGDGAEEMKDTKALLVLAVVITALLAVSIPLQYLVRREVVVGLPSEGAHSHAHAEGEQEHEHEHEAAEGEEETEAEPGDGLSANLISNFSFEVGTYEQIWGWWRKGTDQGAAAYRDSEVARSGFSSAAVSTNGAFVSDAGWYTKLDSVPVGKDVFFEAYVKTQGLRGQAYLRILAQGLKEGQEKEQLIISSSTDDVHGDSDWTYSSLRCFIPPEATGVWLEVGVFGAGKAWFDDLSLRTGSRQGGPSSGVNLIVNPTLEDGARHWHLATNADGFYVDFGNPSLGPDGGRDFFFRVPPAAPAGNAYCWFFQSIDGFYGQQGILTFSGWMRAEGLDGSGLAGLRMLGPGGEKGYRSVSTVSGNDPWTEFKVEVPLDGETVSVWVILDLEGSGSFYLSGLNLAFTPL